jgi:hypothetical protein
MTSYETLVAWAMIMALAFAASVAQGWEYGHATFYGDMSGAETMSKYYFCLSTQPTRSLSSPSVSLDWGPQQLFIRIVIINLD